MSDEHYRQLKNFARSHWERCTECDRLFARGDMMTIGYKSDGSMAVACQKCAKLITGERYEQPHYHRDYEFPDESTKVWRYIDFTKFVSLLDSSSLYFTRADKFEDPFEGARGFKYQEDEAYKTVTKFHELQILAAHKDENFTQSDLDREVADSMTKAKENYANLRKKIFISCWHANEVESEAMWKLYTSSVSQGLAIQSTVGKLIESIEENTDVEVGKVKYVDYEQPLKANMNPYWYKRSSFSHENEIRAIIVDDKCTDSGVMRRANLPLLFENIYVSPLAARWFFELVEQVLKKYGISCPIHYSQLNQEPIY